MTFRKHIVAGLVAILGAPAVTLAASSGPTWYDIQNDSALRQRHADVQKDAAETSATTAAAAGKSKSAGPDAEATKAWSLKHWKAMQQGADHEKASAEASKG